MFIVGYNQRPLWKATAGDFGNAATAIRRTLGTTNTLLSAGVRVRPRGKITDIVRGLPGVGVLEANIDARPSKRKSTYPKPVTEQFDFVFGACRPNVIIAHGTDAVVPTVR
ncbi:MULTISPECIES: hypothetical protein [unclassified Mesorhizobium]|uniref:hypothetical protein n=1 Tax=unclassified Mesorhizobium TaxID=325217 RepID=UPI0011291A11|nr:MULTISPECIES: hypothetical protein [unclassified Mesorhizobium]TPI77687.1 hypothetical protein FJ423_18225 [Mesorhizobium sp. B2-8-9]TPJ30838.1 hypothetical protein FJ425_03670 [Mesorhizobium sp. B2-7-2]